MLILTLASTLILTRPLTSMASSNSRRVDAWSSGWKRTLRNLTAAVRSPCHWAGVNGPLQLRFTGVPAQGSLDVTGSGALRFATGRRQKRKMAAYTEIAL